MTNPKLPAGKYADLTKDQLIALLRQRDETRLGLVWERDPTLIEADQSVNEDFIALDFDADASCGTGAYQHLLIEGDNFDALRALRMTHAGRVRCIYIDPPYNTGNKDFIYNDRFVKKDDVWKHSTWLEYLYRRILISRDLLTDDGVLMASINDENRAKLELMLDKIFPGRRVGSFVWRTKDSGNDAGGNLSQVHEHVLVYGNAGFAFKGKALTFDDYRDTGDKRGKWTPQPLTCNKTITERQNLYYPIQNPKTGYWYPCDPNTVWRYASESRVKPETKLRSETMEGLIRLDEIYFPPCKPSEVMHFETRGALLEAIRKGKGPILPKKKTPLLREDLPDLEFWIGKPIAPGRPSRKDFLDLKKKMIAPVSSWIAGQKEEVDYLYDETEETLELLRSPRGGEGTDALNEILGSKIFNHPKPPTLMRNLIDQATRPGDFVLDFFGGSGTTGQAVLELNQRDEGNRKFILVSSREDSAKEPEKNVCRDVCAKRLANVIQGYGTAPGTGGSFAYLKTRRLEPGKVVRKLAHTQVWTALQLMHLDCLNPEPPSGHIWSAGNDAALLIYLPKVDAAALAALKQKKLRQATVYSWQPELVAQHAGKSVSVRPIPQFLLERFGFRP
jgi:adenine-specific DNA-methyltransferase